MTHKSQMVADVATFLNTDENADLVYYNAATAPIAAVVEFGEDAGKGNAFSSQGSAARAFIFVSAANVPTPAVGDRFVFGTTTWRMDRMAESDGIMHKLECSSSESPW
jgi:hypothetical protein